MRVAHRALAAGLLFVVIAAAGCHWTSKPYSYGQGAEFSGLVVDQTGNGIAGARVEVNGATTRSAAGGAFRFAVRTAPRYVLNVSHADYADISYITREAMRGNRWALTRAQSSTVDPTQPIALADTRPELVTKGIGGARFTLPANALVDPRGNPATGPLRATIATLDVSRGEGPGDWAVRSDDGRTEGYLVSYGAVFIQFTDASGAKYQIRSGTAGDLSLPVIPSMAAHAPSTPDARFWYYDTSDGYWKGIGPTRFDSATNAYVGKVDHLSTINTDIAKFDNAACLKVTVDPSIAPGSKLRIRYHSGGTPYGQAPVLVLDDPVNAAFRLPANTNVLLELLDASDVAFGDFVVEDPAGMPLVTTVVNTGPPIPSGMTLWPDPPFPTCKAIVIRRALPQVELRVNARPSAPGARDLPSDDYVTWAPTFCLARLTSGPASNVVLTNAPGGGEVNFAAYADPWPVNTTATAATLALSLPADGSWVPFVIAGRFGSPSTNDKDTIVEAHLNTAGGATVGTKALMVRVRKNANTLTADERARFLFAFRDFRIQLGQNYVQFQEMHRLAATAGDEGHVQPAFLPWHRAMLLHVERELQKIDPSVALHYWNWDAAAPAVFTSDFMGAPQMPFSPASFAEPDFSITNPLNGWDTDLPFSTGELRRNRRNHAAVASAGWFKPLDHPIDDSLVDRANYGPRSGATAFSSEVEALAHDSGHVWPCGAGHVRFPTRSAADPLFYLLHSQIEREWAYWQRAQNRHGVPAGAVLTFPFPAHYDNNGNWNDAGVTTWQRGSFLEDGMWPWDGTTGGAVGRAQRPINQAPPSPPAPFDEDVPDSRPLVLSSPFPASRFPNLWPSAAAVPRPRDVIDYMGKFRPGDGLGFCYDDVAY